jgi:hypothetical protein
MTGNRGRRWGGHLVYPLQLARTLKTDLNGRLSPDR